MDPRRSHVEVRPDEAPRAPSCERPYIFIRHPAYPTTAPPLLQFRAVDRTWEGVKAVHAFDHDTALIACGIVTGNTWSNGYIGLKLPNRNLYVKLRPERGEVLRTHEEYYYFVNDRTPPECKSGGVLFNPALSSCWGALVLTVDVRRQISSRAIV
jgi:hypothetical protein